MTDTLDAATERALVEWIESHTRGRGTIHARGYQGETYLYETKSRRLIVKVAPGRGVRGWVSRWMLEREHRAYARLKGFAGAPKCYGLYRRRYLVLDYVDGVPARKERITDPEAFFGTLLEHVKELHRRGVAHADLKRRDNLLVVDGREPRLIDFGAAIVRKPGFAPLNHYLYRMARRFDLNAWVRLKYGPKFHQTATPEHRSYYRRTTVEKVAGTIKRSYVSLRLLMRLPPEKYRRAKNKSRNA